MGTATSLGSLLTSGPILITFYRGNWCLFCNIHLRGLQQHLPAFKEAGVQLVAITPELPDESISTVEKNNLDFTVLSDVDNKLARDLGITYMQPENMKAVFEYLSVDWEKTYGADAAKRGLVVPVPASFLVDQDYIVRERHVEPNYHERLEPEVALEWIKTLTKY